MSISFHLGEVCDHRSFGASIGFYSGLGDSKGCYSFFDQSNFLGANSWVCGSSEACEQCNGVLNPVDGSEIPKTHQLRLVVSPITYISQVVVWDFFHQRYDFKNVKQQGSSGVDSSLSSKHISLSSLMVIFSEKFEK